MSTTYHCQSETFSNIAVRMTTETGLSYIAFSIVSRCCLAPVSMARAFGGLLCEKCSTHYNNKHIIDSLSYYAMSWEADPNLPGTPRMIQEWICSWTGLDEEAVQVGVTS